VRCVLRSGCSWPNIVFGRRFGHCSRFMTDDAFGGSVSVRGSTSRSAVRSVYRFKFTTYHVIWRFGSSALRPRFENEFMSGDSLGVFGHRGSSSSLARTVHARRFGHRGSGSCSRFKFRFRSDGSCSAVRSSRFRFVFGVQVQVRVVRVRSSRFRFVFGVQVQVRVVHLRVRSSRFRFVFGVQIQVRVVHLRSSVIEVQVRVPGSSSGSGRSSSEFGHRGSGSCSGSKFRFGSFIFGVRSSRFRFMFWLRSSMFKFKTDQSFGASASVRGSG
jgi:hypothetical protein